MKLSICIATFNRGRFIGETLDSILSQMQSNVELIVVDGASSDNTPDVMARYVSDYPEIRYFRETENSGVDADFDKAVEYAKGEYCWLMSDDDLLHAGAINHVLAELDGIRNLVIVNAEVKNADLSKPLLDKHLAFTSDKYYSPNESELFVSECLNYLSFIGCVVIKRKAWLDRNRADYYGSLFIHIGVIFQTPILNNVYIISTPLITIRYGNAMWTSRGFEIWMFKWPTFVWSFASFSNETKQRVCDPAPWKKIKTLLYYRATGAYSIEGFNKFVDPNLKGIKNLIAHGVAIFPAAIANFIVVLYFLKFNRKEQMSLYDLLRNKHAGILSHWVAKFFGVDFS